MSDLSLPNPEEAFVERVRLARQSGAVLKARLITLRTELPEAVVLAFEGDDDKIVYGQWIRRIRPGLRYEPFPCGGKQGVRELRNTLTRDLTRLGDHVYFLVDRDYDDLAGFDSIDNVFMTDSYAVENYLVADDVLEELLRDEFPCHARPDVRKQIVSIFRKDYKEFLDITTSINLRLYVARRMRINLVKRLPSKLRYLAVVQLGNVRASPTPAEEVVVYEHDPSDHETLPFTHSFKQLDPELHYRGKFAMKFFKEWLSRLAVEYAAGASGALGQTMPSGEIRHSELVLSNFASKSRLPTDLPPFINAIN